MHPGFRGREGLFVLLRVNLYGGGELFQIVHALRLPRFFTRFGEDWKENGSQYRNDGDNDQKLDQGKTLT
jgi:hypothetical protein